MKDKDAHQEVKAKHVMDCDEGGGKKQKLVKAARILTSSLLVSMFERVHSESWKKKDISMRP